MSDPIIGVVSVRATGEVRDKYGHLVSHTPVKLVAPEPRFLLNEDGRPYRTRDGRPVQIMEGATVGFSPVNFLDKALNTITGTTFTGAAASFIKLHTGDPGVGAGNAAVGSATRVVFTMAAASAGSKAMNGTLPVWTNGGTSETISHISIWDASSAGNFELAGALTASQAWVNTNTFTLTALTIAFTPVAA